MASEGLSIYFAGALFNHKDLIGNRILANVLERISEGRYRCVLPQDLESSVSRAIDVRNQDLKSVIEADLTLFHFDGTELDSGTIVEFMVAKMLDIPAVVIRTDFRLSGDQSKDGDPWNLMCSGYPRTKVILRNGMKDYQNASRRSSSEQEMLNMYLSPVAHLIDRNFIELLQHPSLFGGDIDKAQMHYDWAIRFPGGGLMVPSGWTNEIVKRKAQNRLI